MEEEENRVVGLNVQKRKRDLIEKAREWEESLPPPSQRFKNLIFLYPEELAMQGRELLFRMLDSAAEKNMQSLVISDCHYSRGGFYVVIDEIGPALGNPIDIDEIIESWRNRDKQ